MSTSTNTETRGAMRAAIDRLVKDLADTAMPLRSDRAIEDARLVIADSVMCALLEGGSEATGSVDARGVRYWSGSTEPARAAVERNAVQAHQRELDPVQFVTCGHPGVVIAPALSALVDLDVLSRRDALGTFVLATEVMAFLGQAWGPGLAAQGTHATAFLGPMAAVAAVGRARRWSLAGLESALFAAAALGAGSTAAFGTSLKPIQVGRAAGLAVDLVTCPPTDNVGSRWIDELERRFGPPQDDWITEDAPRLGGDLVIDQVPSMFKLLPACAYFASALDHVLEGVRSSPAGELVELVLDVPKEAFAVDHGGVPTRPEQVPFALAYLIACLWVGRRPGDFRTSPWRTDPDVARLVPRIRVRALPGRFDFIDSRLDGELRISTANGEVVRSVTYLARPRLYDVADLTGKWKGLGEDQAAPPLAALQALLADLATDMTPGPALDGWFPRFYNLIRDLPGRQGRHPPGSAR